MTGDDGLWMETEQTGQGDSWIWLLIIGFAVMLALATVLALVLT